MHPLHELHMKKLKKLLHIKIKINKIIEKRKVKREQYNKKLLGKELFNYIKKTSIFLISETTVLN